MLLSKSQRNVVARQGKRPPARQMVALAATRRSRRGPSESGADADETATSSSSSSSNSMTPEKKARLKVLQETMYKINAKHGQGTVMHMSGDALAVERFSSGCLTLDKALGGGYPKGRIVEIYGPEASGKTTLALHAIAEVQKRGGVACFIDAEHAFDAAYATKLGIQKEALVTTQPDYGEQAFNVMDELVRSGAVDLVVVDSVSALVPRSEIEGDIGTPQIGSQARLMSVALRKIAAHANKCGCTIIFINQLRNKVGVMFGNPETTSGGNALKYYSTIRLDIRAKDKILEAGRAEPVGNKVKVKVVKNKVSSPYEVAEFDILYGEGINALGCVVDVAKDLEVVEARGSHYYFEGSKLAQGRENVITFLRENPDTAARVATAVKQRLAEGGGGSKRRAVVSVSGSLGEGVEFDDDEDDDGDEGFGDELLDDEALLDDLNKQANRLEDS